MVIDANGTTIQHGMNLSESSEKVKDLPKADEAREISLRQTSKDLESVFITQMFKAMEKTVPKSSLAGSNNSLATMMFSSIMGEALANQGGIGLSEIIYNSLKEKQDIPSMDEMKSNSFLDNLQQFRLLDNNNIE